MSVLDTGHKWTLQQTTCSFSSIVYGGTYASNEQIGVRASWFFCNSSSVFNLVGRENTSQNRFATVEHPSAQVQDADLNSGAMNFGGSQVDLVAAEEDHVNHGEQHDNVKNSSSHDKGAGCFYLNWLSF